MEDTRGAVNVILKGPAHKLERALATIQAQGIFAKRDLYEPAAISAFFHDGTNNPPQAFVENCEARMREIAAVTGFEVDRTSVWGSNAATRLLPHDRHTGEWLEEFIDGETPLALREEQLQSLAERRGISVNDIELRDYLQPPTD